MKNSALTVAGLIFLLIGFLHLLRMAFGVSVVVGGWVIPQWFSLIGMVVMFLLSLWCFKSHK